MYPCGGSGLNMMTEKFLERSKENTLLIAEMSRLLKTSRETILDKISKMVNDLKVFRTHGAFLESKRDKD